MVWSEEKKTSYVLSLWRSDQKSPHIGRTSTFTVLPEFLLRKVKVRPSIFRGWIPGETRKGKTPFYRFGVLPSRCFTLLWPQGFKDGLSFSELILWELPTSVVTSFVSNTETLNSQRNNIIDRNRIVNFPPLHLISTSEKRSV